MLSLFVISKCLDISIKKASVYSRVRGMKCEIEDLGSNWNVWHERNVHESQLDCR